MEHFKIENLTFSYPNSERKVLDRVSLSIERGAYVTVCGKSGSGKTTLLRHLKTALTPHGTGSGEVFFEGRPLAEVSVRRQSAKIGFVMQNPDNQTVTDRVWHELAFGLESLGCDQRTMRLRVAEMASYFGIHGWFHKKTGELSGGQKQLLNLASIMAMQPEALILDEPVSQLDPIAAADFLNTVRKINLELGTTVLLSEHRLEEVFPVADRVLVMEGGRIVADGPPRVVGGILKQQGSDMIKSLPSPVQIYYGVKSSLNCPLTVREGRDWLTKELSPKTGSVLSCLPGEQQYEEPEKPALELKEVCFRYKKELSDVLKGVNLKVTAGCLHGVVGGNGTGKSTMLKTVCGILKPYRGKVLIEGKRLEKYKGNALFENCLAMLPQDPLSLFVKKTVREELEEMLQDKGGGKTGELLKMAARECDLEHLLDVHPYDLSGGEQQRAALAKTLLCNPRILLLDEPTKGMDNFFKEKLAQILGRMKQRGITVLMVSHDVEFCARYADEVSMFFDGSVITTNTPRRFFSQNSFYTTAANRMSRHVMEYAVTNEDVIALVQANVQAVKKEYKK